MSGASAPKPGETVQIELQPGMMAEVMTPDNRLLFVGRVDKVQETGVSIRETNDETLPMVLVNKPVKVRFYRETDNIVLHGKVCGSTIKMWKVDRLQSTFTSEQRAFFRQSISVNIEAQCGRPNRAGRSGALFPCKVLDISAGGMLISSAEVYIEGAWKKGVNRYGCQFEALAPRDQDRLLQAIFTIQREEIKKRKPR